MTSQKAISEIKKSLESLGLDFPVDTFKCLDTGKPIIRVTYFNGEKNTSKMETVDKYFSASLFMMGIEQILDYLKASDQVKREVNYSAIHPSQYNPQTFKFELDPSYKEWEEEILKMVYL